ncbi:MAG TPA: hypothetical protein VHG32_25165 [Thermoanaerobaculia bacterium]|jgi:hypothetical protein|nr:hypothetical protein [Thermoanaerobaculia bacterium]
MSQLTIRVPEDLDFAALSLRRDPVSREVSFAWAPIERICEVSGVDIQVFRAGHEDNVSGLIIAWYNIHRQHGGAPDAVAEQLLAEVDAENRYGEINVQPRCQRRASVIRRPSPRRSIIH